MRKKTSDAAPLVQDERQFMEAAFAQDFANVRIVTQPHFPVSKSNQENNILGSSKFNEIFITPYATGMMRKMILAHELAHVLQRRNASVGCGEFSGAEALEREAHYVARVVATGRPVRCHLADRENLPRAWMEAGHYYTVYYVLRAAGITPEMAECMAFLAQMPDEVKELDGVQVGIAANKAIIQKT